MTAKCLTVRNISKEKVATSNHKSPIISISDRYSHGVAIPGEKAGRPVLQIDFFAGDYWESSKDEDCMTPEIAKRIYDFIQSLPDDTTELLVNCGEGKIRSYTVCMALYREFDFVEHHEGSGQLDRWTYHILRTELHKLRERRKQQEESASQQHQSDDDALALQPLAIHVMQRHAYGESDIVTHTHRDEGHCEPTRSTGHIDVSPSVSSDSSSSDSGGGSCD